MLNAAEFESYKDRLSYLYHEDINELDRLYWYGNKFNIKEPLYKPLLGLQDVFLYGYMMGVRRERAKRRGEPINHIVFDF